MEYVNINKLRYIDSEDVILTKEDAYKVFSFVRDIKPMHEIFYKVLYHTGMRLSELSGLTWDNVDLDKRIIKVRQQMQFQTSKGHILVLLNTKSSGRDIHFWNTLYDELINQKNKLNDLKIHSQFVCSKYNGSAIYKEDIEKVNRLINRELLRFKAHSVRKLHATMLIEAGAEIKNVSARLGHSNTRITYEIYVKNTNRLIDKTVSIFESVL
ncbi:site-specific integrase [Romboutsia weinsteinii]|uniref:Site-specific integrase n=1 Tax=Romboutsia weinsteinii TaxID=2020949 RepID=A0A371J556_9FIRM|nr:site-specific integrase [Romboutsia weinsteinii]RDY27912.1 site-specific integrase [Romboutsia weinsteinii]